MSFKIKGLTDIMTGFLKGFIISFRKNETIETTFVKNNNYGNF